MTNAVARQNMMVLTSHVMLPGFRKTSMHFVVEAWARSGHTVYFTTVGYSSLSRLKRNKRYIPLRDAQSNRYVQAAPNIYSGAHLPLLHAFSSGLPFLSGVEMLAFKLYGNHLPSFISKRLETTDIVVLESGTPLAFFNRIKALNPSAKVIYFCRDKLASIGASQALVDMEQDVARLADLVVVPSPRIADKFGQSNNVRVVPQGIDKSLFRNESKNPYSPGSKNGLVVGDMLFDREAVSACAAANLDVNFHLFGVNWQNPPSGNIIVHGEVSFDALVPYLQHANFGFAPYDAGPDEIYLAESSLKLLQYAACLLPTILPQNIPATRGNEVRYSIGASPDWKEVVDTALRLPKSHTWDKGILDWTDVARDVLKPFINQKTVPLPNEENSGESDPLEAGSLEPSTFGAQANRT